MKYPTHLVALLVVAAFLSLTGQPGQAASPEQTAVPVVTAAPAPSPTPTPSGPPADAIVSFHSRPDLRPPVLDVDAASDAGDDLLFVTPRYGGEGEGVMILDAEGALVWLHRVPGRSAAAFQPTRFHGKPALSWWEGVIEDGLGDGEFVIVDQNYREVARIRTAVRPTDLHELFLTGRDTAYVLTVDHVERDGQPITDMLVEEVDVESGRTLWTWRASDHIALDESVEPVPGEGAWDYVHFNSIDVDADGDLVLSARHTDAVYKVSRRNGDIIWRLGGIRSDFELPEGAVFRKQHDARVHPGGLLSLFDNATKDVEDTAQPRGLLFRLDERAGTAELVRQLPPPRAINASSQGNFDLSDAGTATIGWGSANLVTGYAEDDATTFDAAMPGGFSSYRAYRGPWRGQPLDDPIVAIKQGADGATVAWVSWNGATEVAEWQLLAGDDVDSLKRAGRSPRDGFETGLRLPDGAAVVKVRALDGRGRELGTSRLMDIGESLAASDRAG